MYYLSNPNSMTKDCVDGMTLVYPDLVQTIPGSYNGRALLRNPIEHDRVNLIISAGGTGGPFCQAFATSPQLADIAINGGVFAAPSAYDIYEAAKTVNSSHGYLLMYNNFMGDCLNNDLAQELLELEGYKARLTAFHDDCLSAPENAPRTERTGLIGILYALKIAAFASRGGMSLDELVSLMELVDRRMSSLMLTFDFDKKLVMMGEGISGEPAPIVHEDCFNLKSAAQLAYDKLFQDLSPRSDEKIYFLVNRMFFGNYEDAYILSKFLYEYALTRTPIHQMSTGHYARMSGSYGFSVTMLCGDARIEPYLQKRCFTDSFIL